MEQAMTAPKRIFFLYEQNGETILALHANGCVESSRELSDAEKSLMFDQMVKGWASLSSWVTPPTTLADFAAGAEVSKRTT